MKIQLIKDAETKLEALYVHGHKVLEGDPIKIEDVINLFANDKDTVEFVYTDENFAQWNKCFKQGKFTSYWPF